MPLPIGTFHLYFLDDSRNFPAGGVAEEFVEGNFNNYEDVLAFGADKDVLSIEIEHVNTRALETLQAKGVTVHPHPEALDLIKDKGLQKLFYQEHGLPSAPFELFEDEQAVRHAVQTGRWQYPFVQKSRTAGYDGKGVSIIRNESDLQHKLLPGSCLLEARVDIQKELAVIVARNADGEIAAFPVVEMDFNPEANLVEFLICPARIDPAIEKAAIELSKRCIETFGICGLLAVELFLTPDQQILINEVAPRPHNSGHHTIDSCYTSQFEQHLRGILNLPLGSTAMKCPSVMVNLLGAEGFSGPTRYVGLEDCLALPGVKLHFYGKSSTKPYRKMGHATVLAENIDEAVRIAKLVQQKLSIQA
nr:5-(carboxyamino)imidazole ribonucleotide synthase [Haliscomenobacter sp.]